MTVHQFFDKYNGKGIDFDGYYGFQCMDLAQAYNKEVIGAPRLSGNAADVWNTYPTAYYTRITNTPNGVPQAGDIIIWAKALNGFGHIAVFKEGGVWNFTSFDQNWPLGSVCHFQPHNYNYVLGWLRPKKIPLTDSQKLEKIKQIVFSGIPSEDKVNQIKAVFA